MGIKSSVFSDNVPVYLFIHLKGQLMQIALRNEIQERISAETVSSKLKKITCFPDTGSKFATGVTKLVTSLKRKPTSRKRYKK
jgi:hypothetical protein